MVQSFLIIYTGCKRPHSGLVINSRIKAMVNNIEGIDLDVFNTDDIDDITEKKTDSVKGPSSHERTILDLQNAIKTISSPFPEDACPKGEEYESFTSRIEPIVGQMENLSINPYHRYSVMFALLTGSAPVACKFLKLRSLSLGDMISDIKKKVLFDGEIQYRRVTRWTTVCLDVFRKASIAKKMLLEVIGVYYEVSEESPKAHAFRKTYLQSHSIDLSQHTMV